MKEIIKLALNFILRFGFIKGLKLFIKFKIGNVSSVKLPGIKHPISLRPGTSDIPTFYDVFLFKEYDISIAKPSLIIDAGANIGLFTIWIKNKYPDAIVICIEPDTENFKLLKKNLSYYDKIYFENSGIWNKDALLKVYDKYDLGKWGIVVEESNEFGTVPAISVPSLMKKYSFEYIDLFKIDIERSEKQLFQKNYDFWLPKVKTIFIELHDWLEQGCSKPFFEAINRAMPNYSFSSKGETTVIKQTLEENNTEYGFKNKENLQ